ncbi:hypothetical protein CDAR_80431, partial [Caerostris darwini]
SFTPQSAISLPPPSPGELPTFSLPQIAGGTTITSHRPSPPRTYSHSWALPRMAVCSKDSSSHRLAHYSPENSI